MRIVGPLSLCSRGGIGRRVRLRTVWGNPWRFESSREQSYFYRGGVGLTSFFFSKGKDNRNGRTPVQIDRLTWLQLSFLPPTELSSTGKAVFVRQGLFRLSSWRRHLSTVSFGRPLSLPNELWRQLQVWRESQLASSGGPLWRV